MSAPAGRMMPSSTTRSTQGTQAIPSGDGTDFIPRFEMATREPSESASRNPEIPLSICESRIGLRWSICCRVTTALAERDRSRLSKSANRVTDGARSLTSTALSRSGCWSRKTVTFSSSSARRARMRVGRYPSRRTLIVTESPTRLEKRTVPSESVAVLNRSDPLTSSTRAAGTGRSASSMTSSESLRSADRATLDCASARTANDSNTTTGKSRLGQRV